MTIPLGPAHLGPMSFPAIRTAPVAANDNGAEPIEGGLLRAALHHFADHGLGAAELAHQRAEQAFFAGNGKEYRHWLDICRALDRRMADRTRFRRPAPR
jgi:hypothetical protein